VFEGSLLGTAILVPLLGRSMLGEVGVTARQFLLTAVVPPTIAVIAAAAAAGVVVVLHLPDWPTVIVGGFAGGVAYLVVASRVALQPGELRKLKETVLGHR